jgi:Zn-finger nucleic acid-binding protein
MKCPSCNVDLTTKVIDKIEIDECEKCRGIWFDANELRKTKDLTDEDLTWLDFNIWKHEDKFKAKSRNLPCPKCNSALVAIDYADTDVEIDYCPACKGTWLDSGEFQKIIEALTNELLSTSFSEYIKASLVEAKEVLVGPEPFLSEWKDFSTVLRMMKYRLFVEKPGLLNTVIALNLANPLK